VRVGSDKKKRHDIPKNKSGLIHRDSFGFSIIYQNRNLVVIENVWYEKVTQGNAFTLGKKLDKKMDKKKHLKKKMFSHF